MKNLKWLLQQNSKTPSQNIKISSLFQNSERKWGSCQLIAHGSMDLGKRVPSSLPRRHRGPLAPQHQRSCPSHCHPLAHYLHPWEFSETSNTNQGSLWRGRQCQIRTSGLTERCWWSVGASQHPLGCMPSSNREFGRKLKKDFSAIHISIGDPVGPCRAGRKDQAAQFVCSLLCAHQLFQNNSSSEPSNVQEGCER